MPLSEAQPDALASVYARSLYQLADEAGGQQRIEEVNDELESILELSRADPKFSEFLASRILGRKERARSLDAIFKGRIQDLTLRFLHILNAKARLYHLPAVAAALDRLVQERFGKIEVDVYTAAPITPEEQREIRAQLQRVLKREPVLHSYTDPRMIGGVRLQIEDQLIDASISTQLRRLREQISGPGAAELRARADRLIEGAEG
ncbi:MAG: ATP synthase F1 subunit delta [Phycisphaerales bacterium]